MYIAIVTHNIKCNVDTAQITEKSTYCFGIRCVKYETFVLMFKATLELYGSWLKGVRAEEKIIILILRNEQRTKFKT